MAGNVQERGYGATTGGLDTGRRFARIAGHPLTVGVLVVAILALGYLGYRNSQGGSDPAELGSAPMPVDDGDASDSAATDANGDDGDTTEEPDPASPDEPDPASAQAEPDGSAPIPPVPDGPYVAATLNLDKEPTNGLFILSGRVPDQATADALLEAAEVSYAPYVQSELVVDTTLEPAPWLANGANVIGLLPSVTDGTIMVAEEKITLSARSPRQEYVALLEGALTQLGGGLPVEVSNVTITDLNPPRFVVDVRDGQATLEGEVPSDEIVQILAGGAAQVYGQDNVVNELTVNPNTWASLWMETMPVSFQLFAVFPAYSFTVEDGFFSGSFQGGVNFDTNSSEVSPLAADALGVGVSVMRRDPSIGMIITGHTDSDGSDGYNQNLSLNRAQSVIDFFVAGGVDPARMVAVGAGESEPMVDNSSEENRARNRRVEIELVPVSALPG